MRSFEKQRSPTARANLTEEGKQRDGEHRPRWLLEAAVRVPPGVGGGPRPLGRHREEDPGTAAGRAPTTNTEDRVQCLLDDRTAGHGVEHRVAVETPPTDRRRGGRGPRRTIMALDSGL